MKKIIPFIILTLLLVASGCTGNPAELPAAGNDTAALNSPAVVDPTPADPEKETPEGDGSTRAAPTRTPVPEPDRPAAAPTSTPADGDVNSANTDPPGALIHITLTSQVGILLDDFPENMRDEAAAIFLEQDDAVWRERAIRQIRHTRNRLNFRDFVYAGKGQLPLPPESQWEITLDDDGPTRQEIQGHDLILLNYTLTTTLLTDVASPAISEPALAEEGGVWIEPFIFPADPDYLLQRTGNACVNEGGFPPNSYDAENVWHFYDFACTPDSTGPLGCHRTTRPAFSCREALDAFVGEVAADIRFERLEWDKELADAVRLGEITSLNGPDLAAVEEDLTINRIVYRFFEEADCAIEEEAVGGTGWRRLLLFDATVRNVGAESLHIGRANVQDDENNVFTYSACHDHFHYSNYGSFFLEDFEDITGSKQAFCVQSTTRMSNNETAPLIHDYSCTFQGIQVGWADEYIAGLDAQWIDITALNIPAEGTTVGLGFASNEDKFLCEGAPVVDENGEQIWEFSGQFASDGHIINRPVCDFIDGWEANNVATTPVLIPAAGSYVTQACPADEISPLRNCGFEEVEIPQTTCNPGAAVELRLPEPPEEPLIVRVCERSAQLDSGVACAFENSMANAVLSAGEDSVQFNCPVIRDAERLTGGFSVLTAPLFP